MHGSDFGFLLTCANDINELVGGDRVICEVINVFLNMFGKTRADDDGDEGISKLVISKKPVVFAFLCDKIFEFN